MDALGNSTSDVGPSPENQAARSTPQAQKSKRVHACRTQIRYWNDESYAHFYALSNEEQRVLRKASAGAGLTSASSARAYKAWQIHGSGTPLQSSEVRVVGASGCKPSEARIACFQRVFAELSNGKGWIRPRDVHALFRAMELGIPAPEVRELLENIQEGDEDLAYPVGRITYDEAFLMYRRALLPESTEEAQAAVDSALDAILSEDVVASGFSESVLPPGKKWSRPGSVQEEALALDSVESRRGTALLPELTLAERLADRVCRKGMEKHAAPHASLYQPPHRETPRGASIFKRVGRFQLSPRAVLA